MIERLSLRRAVATDASAVSALTRMASMNGPLIARTEADDTDYDRRRRTIIDLWEEGGALLALIEMILEVDCLLIENIAVRPSAGQGIGKAPPMPKAPRIPGFDNVRLYTNAAFESNLQLYSRHGYQEFQRAAVAPDSVVVHMRKRIGRSSYRSPRPSG